MIITLNQAAGSRLVLSGIQLGANGMNGYALTKEKNLRTVGWMLDYCRSVEKLVLWVDGKRTSPYDALISLMMRETLTLEYTDHNGTKSTVIVRVGERDTNGGMYVTEPVGGRPRWYDYWLRELDELTEGY